MKPLLVIVSIITLYISSLLIHISFIIDNIWVSSLFITLSLLYGFVGFKTFDEFYSK